MIKKMKNALTFVRDQCWVLQAYLRGKVLRQKTYRPKGNFFPGLPGGTCRRMLILIKWWGFRPMTMEEALEELQSRTPPYDRVPYLNWEEGEWQSYEKWSKDWDNSYRFPTFRR